MSILRTIAMFIYLFGYMILSGECDELPESAFLFAGTIDDVFAKAKKG